MHKRSLHSGHMCLDQCHCKPVGDWGAETLMFQCRATGSSASILGLMGWGNEGEVGLQGDELVKRNYYLEEWGTGV